MNYNHIESFRLITGKSGTGKTTYFLRAIAGARHRYKFLFDPQREISRKLRWRPVQDSAGVVYCVRVGLPVCFDPSRDFAGRPKEGFAWFTRLSLELSKELRGPKLFACDELQKYTALGRGGVPGGLAEILDIGRKEEIDGLFVAQRVNKVNDDIRAQLTELVTFQHTDRLPLRWLEDDGFDPELVSRLKSPGQYLRRNLKTGQWLR